MSIFIESHVSPELRYTTDSLAKGSDRLRSILLLDTWRCCAVEARIFILLLVLTTIIENYLFLLVCVTSSSIHSLASLEDNLGLAIIRQVVIWFNSMLQGFTAIFRCEG